MDRMLLGIVVARNHPVILIILSAFRSKLRVLVLGFWVVERPKLSDHRRKRPVGCNSRGQNTQTVQKPSGAAVRCRALVVRPRSRLACEILAVSWCVGTTGSHKTCATQLAPHGSGQKPRQHRAPLPNHPRLLPIGVRCHSVAISRPPVSHQSQRGNLTPKAARETRESNLPTLRSKPRRRGDSRRKS